MTRPGTSNAPGADAPNKNCQRWHQLQRCLHEIALPVRVRVAGALVLLYGQPVSRIIQLEAAQLSRCHGQAYLVLDRHPVLIPPSLADLIDQLHATATVRVRPDVSVRVRPGVPVVTGGFPLVS